MQRSYRSYLNVLATSFVLLLVTTALFILLVDPYRFFASPLAQGFNVIKPKPSIMRDEMRLNLALKQKPELLFVGNSRFEMGINPESALVKSVSSRAQNFTIPGNTLAQAIPSLERIGELNSVKVMVLGLDFQDYLTARDRHDLARAELSVSEALINFYIDPKWISLLQFDTLTDSIRTVLLQSEKYPETIFASGFNPAYDYQKYLAREGHHSLFEQSLASLRTKILKAKQLPDFLVLQTDSDRFREVTSILDSAKKSGWRVEMVIYPVHAEALALYEQQGVSNLLYQWKVQMKIRADRAASGGTQVRLHDFACLSEITTEPVPRRGDLKSRMRYYFEAGHFQQNLGDLIVKETIRNSKTPLSSQACAHL